jgi:hypothetical protein
MNGRAWTFYDKRSGKRASFRSYPTVAAAEFALENLQRTSRGDDRRLAFYLEVVELTPETWGTLPGEVITEIKGE